MSLFVTFEGPDGSGKSTQTSLVTSRLRTCGHTVVTTREPGGTPLGERVRALLLDGNNYAIVPRAEALLMTAARAQHVEEVVKPALQGGAIVICDRFIDSTLAYQGAGRGIPIPDLTNLQMFAVGPVVPALTILLDLPPEAGIRRLRESGEPLNRLDQDELAFHERVHRWYVDAAAREPDRWYVLNALRPADELADDITQRVLRSLSDQENGGGTNRMSG